jgi:hypothetical protein
VPPNAESTTQSSTLAELLRALYLARADYCVMLSPDMLIFTKDQLVAMIERSSAERQVSEIRAFAADGLFKPIAAADLLNEPSFELEHTYALVMSDDGSEVSTLKEALNPGTPAFPVWWTAPIWLAMHRRGKIYLNGAAAEAFGGAGPGQEKTGGVLSLLERAAKDLPTKDEFLVELNVDGEPLSIAFRRISVNIFLMEDCDAAAAADIAWWAAVGKAWAATLDREGWRYRRCGKTELDEMKVSEIKELRENNTLIPCEWEDELLGYLCVSKRQGEPEPEPEPEIEDAGLVPADDDALRVLGPQALGLLAPGVDAPLGEEGDKESFLFSEVKAK